MSAASALDLVLFASAEEEVRHALDAGIQSFIVDWEFRGKAERQDGADTEINADTPADLARLQSCGVTRRFCRINQLGAWTADEVEAAVTAGVTHLFLPMVRAPGEVEEVWRLVDGRCALGILVETTAALECLDALARESVDFVYVGLNDLAISRRSATIFDALLDGTVDRVRAAFTEVPFGCAGVTAIDAGFPIPARTLLAELSRIRCDFSFARRSWRSDMTSRDMTSEVAKLQSAWRQLGQRTASEVRRDREAFAIAVEEMRLRFPPFTAAAARPVR